MDRVQATGKAAYNYSQSSSSSAFIDALLNHGENKEFTEESDVDELEDLNEDNVD